MSGQGKSLLQKSGLMHGPAGVLARPREGLSMPIYGYARVSTCGQELDLQLAQLHAAGCERIYCEKESGAKDDRRELRRMLKSLRPGDVVIGRALDEHQGAPITRAAFHRRLSRP